MAKRINKIQEFLDEKDIDALLIKKDIRDTRGAYIALYAQ